MHIYESYSHPSSCDYFDTTSELAIGLLTEIHCLLTHSFRDANDNGFQFYGYPVGCRHAYGNIRVVMHLLYPATHCIIEEHLDVTPSVNLDVQLVTNLMMMMMMMMEKSCPEHLFWHHCCNLPRDLLA